MSATLPFAADLAQAHPFPRLRWAVLAWLAIYVPAYAAYWGPWHFAQLCNLGLLLTALGVLRGNRLLLSSQALAAPGIALLFAADVAWRLATGAPLHGTTAYLWDTTIPAGIRALSLFDHLAWPCVLAWCVARTGYDRRGLPLQVALAAAAFAFALWVAPAAENLNYVFGLPGRPADAAPLWGAARRGLELVLTVYVPTHLLLAHVWPRLRDRYSSRVPARSPAC
jgi:hypothetical protein